MSTPVRPFSVVFARFILRRLLCPTWQNTFILLPEEIAQARCLSIDTMRQATRDEALALDIFTQDFAALPERWQLNLSGRNHFQWTELLSLNGPAGLTEASCAISFYRSRHVYENRVKTRQGKKTVRIVKNVTRSIDTRRLAKEYIRRARAAGFVGSVTMAYHLKLNGRAA